MGTQDCQIYKLIKQFLKNTGLCPVIVITYLDFIRDIS